MMKELIFALDKMKYDPYEVTYYAKTASYYYRKHGLTLASLEDIAKKQKVVPRMGNTQRGRRQLREDLQNGFISR